MCTPHPRTHALPVNERPCAVDVRNLMFRLVCTRGVFRMAWAGVVVEAVRLNR